jgi:hypothetical protein
MLDTFASVGGSRLSGWRPTESPDYWRGLAAAADGDRVVADDLETLARPRLGLAIRRSQASVRARPAPAAGPLIIAMGGFSNSCRIRDTSIRERRCGVAAGRETQARQEQLAGARG